MPDTISQRHELLPVTQEMTDAYVAWEPPTQFDAGNPVRALGLIRAAYFAGWQASEARFLARMVDEDVAHSALVAAMRYGGKVSQESIVAALIAIAAKLQEQGI